MVSTHALSLVGVPPSHWLFSDIWLPNGWATVVFVVLSGYGVGYIFSVRHPVQVRHRKLYRRVGVVLLVMVLSNLVFVFFRLMAEGDISPVRMPEWWLGFLTLETKWTISGVLLPTALVMLCGPSLIPWIQVEPWDVLVILVGTSLAVSLLAALLQASPEASHWLVRFMLFEGLGSFPVLPFVLNGCMGIWLGVQRHQSENLWLGCIVTLLLLQVATYLTTFMPPGLGWTVWRGSFGAVGKFGWVFLCASFLSQIKPQLVVNALALVGNFALSAFVMHRVFLHLFNAVLISAGLDALSVEWHYLVLCISTLSTTWGACLLHRRWQNRKGAHPGSALISSVNRHLKY